MMNHIIMLKRRYHLARLPWCKFLQHPLWYLIGVACLAGSTMLLQLWWWLTAAVALIWGVWLIWQHFRSFPSQAAGQDEQLQNWLKQALTYQARIRQALQQDTTRRHHFDERAMLAQIDDWIMRIQALIGQLALLHNDKLLRQETTAVPAIIKALETRLSQTSSATSRHQLDRALMYRRKQLAGLQQLQVSVDQAEIQIENTLSLMSTFYIQIITGQSLSHMAIAHNFVAGIADEVDQLQDRLEALCEVKGLSL